MKNNKKNRVGSEAQYDPRPVGEILNNYLENSNEPLAVAYRNRMMYPNTEPCIDLKLLTRQEGRMPVGNCLSGMLTHDEEGHFTFAEDASEKKASVVKRYPHVFQGKWINITRRDDGMLYPTFNRPQYSSEFSFQDFCHAAVEELKAVAGLIEERGTVA